MVKRIAGFTLIELIVFIIVIGIAVSGVFVTFNQVTRDSASPDNNIIAANYAIQRMELILGQKYLNGFATLTDPCDFGTPPAACTAPTGFSASKSIVNSGTDFKIITVTVTGNGDASLVMRVANY